MLGNIIVVAGNLHGKEYHFAGICLRGEMKNYALAFNRF